MGKKILVIEGEKIVRDLLKQRLDREGYLVFVAENGEDGLQLMRTQSPDLVLLDIILPKKNGIELLKEREQDDVLKQIPVIVVSNSGEPQEIEQIKKLGVTDWFVKTKFDPKEVSAKLNTYLNP